MARVASDEPYSAGPKMNTTIRLENTTGSAVTVQVELTGVERILQPGESVLIDTDQQQGQVHVQIGEQRIIVWGGVAADFMSA